MYLKEIAFICHEANRCLQLVNGEGVISLPWPELDQETMESAIDGVDNIIETDATPEESHANWMQFKTEHGWKYGEVKDPEAKTHPCLVPYEDLPENQKIKDSLFHAIVNALA